MPTDSVRLIARIILKLQQGGDFETEYVAPSKPRKFKDLMSRKFNFSVQKQLEMY